MIESNPIVYHIRPLPEKHLFWVKCTVLKPDPAGQTFSLPALIPGSYLIRDFAKHVVSLTTLSETGEPLPVQMLDKSTWQCAKTTGSLSVVYEVYAYDLLPRGAHVDNTHAFLNGSRIFLKISGLEDLPCTVEISPPLDLGYQSWRVATAMNSLNREAAPYGFGSYVAENYEALIDHPIEMGEFEALAFSACGVPHELIVTGKQWGDLNRLCRDLTQICEHHIQFFGLPAPMEKYVFLLTVLGEGYGGLEHRASSAIHCSRECLPKPNEKGVSDTYSTLLGLFSHEYFHTWQIKRIKPGAFAPYDLSVENYTRQLWIFEGITSYYDELALVRTKLISPAQYLNLLAKIITQVISTPGRFKQTLEEASFEAWTKFYKPDENSPNATISYYTKGALVALALDLTLRQKTGNQCSLDQIMQALWQRYGYAAEGVPEGAFERLVDERGAVDFKPFFDSAVRGTEELPLAALLETVGVTVEFLPVAARQSALDIKLKTNTASVELASVLSEGAAEKAGLAANDVIIAVNGIKVEKNTLDTVLGYFSLGDTVCVHAFRRDELLSFQVTLQTSCLQSCTLTLAGVLSESQQEQCNAWLGV